MSEPIDPAAVMAEHRLHEGGDGPSFCEWTGFLSSTRCEPYRLAEALLAEQAKVARVEELAHRFELIPRARLLGALTARPVNARPLDDMRDNEGAGQAAPA